MKEEVMRGFNNEDLGGRRYYADNGQLLAVYYPPRNGQYNLGRRSVERNAHGPVLEMQINCFAIYSSHILLDADSAKLISRKWCKKDVLELMSKYKGAEITINNRE